MMYHDVLYTNIAGNELSTPLYTKFERAEETARELVREYSRPVRLRSWDGNRVVHVATIM